MKDNIIDFGAYQRRKAQSTPSFWCWPKRSPFGAMPGPIQRILVFMLDAPDDPPLVKLAWLFSYFCEVPLPDGQTYRLERGRLEVKHENGWEPSPVTMDGLAHLVMNLNRMEWQAIARSCRRRDTVLRPDGFRPRGTPPGGAPV